MHILHFKMSISASICAIIISNSHLLMYCWNKLQHVQHKKLVIFYSNVIKYDTSHLRQLIGSGHVNSCTTTKPLWLYVPVILPPLLQCSLSEAIHHLKSPKCGDWIIELSYVPPHDIKPKFDYLSYDTRWKTKYTLSRLSSHVWTA